MVKINHYLHRFCSIIYYLHYFSTVIFLISSKVIHVLPLYTHDHKPTTNTLLFQILKPLSSLFYSHFLCKTQNRTLTSIFILNPSSKMMNRQQEETVKYFQEFMEQERRQTDVAGSSSAAASSTAATPPSP